MKGLKAPMNVTKLKLFIGLCNVSRRFIPIFAKYVLPFNTRLRTDQPFPFDLVQKERQAKSSFKKKVNHLAAISVTVRLAAIEMRHRCLPRASRM